MKIKVIATISVPIRVQMELDIPAEMPTESVESIVGRWSKNPKDYPTPVLHAYAEDFSCFGSVHEIVLKKLLNINVVSVHKAEKIDRVDYWYFDGNVIRSTVATECKYIFSFGTAYTVYRTQESAIEAAIKSLEERIKNADLAVEHQVASRQSLVCTRDKLIRRLQI